MLHQCTPEGMYTKKEIFEQRLSVLLDGKQVADWRHKSNQSIYRVVTRRGYFFEDLDVKKGDKIKIEPPDIWVKDYYPIDFSSLQKIGEGRYKNNGMGKSESIRMPKYVDEEFARFLGYFIGGATLFFAIHSEYKEQCEEYRGLLSRLFNMPSTLVEGKHKFRVTAESDNQRKFIYMFGKNAGFFHKGKAKHIPPCLFKSPRKVVLSFFQAWYELKGMVDKLLMKSEELAAQSQELLLNCGILTSRCYEKNDWYIVFDNCTGATIEPSMDSLPEPEWEDEVVQEIEYRGEVFEFI